MDGMDGWVVCSLWTYLMRIVRQNDIVVDGDGDGDYLYDSMWMWIKWSRSPIKDIHQKPSTHRPRRIHFPCARCRDWLRRARACVRHTDWMELLSSFWSNEKNRRTNGHALWVFFNHSRPIRRRNNAKYDSISHDIYLSKTHKMEMFRSPGRLVRK